MRKRLAWVAAIAAATGCSYWAGRAPEMPVAPSAWVTTLDEPSREPPAEPASPSPPSPPTTSHQTCTVDQILSMRNSGLTDEQIHRACE
jgi:hypothetical protein